MEEQELDGDGKVLNTTQKQRKQIKAREEQMEETDPAPQPSACIRDSSRNQLHRLGALYSNPQDLSSPVHRTEPVFSIEQTDKTTSGTKLKKSHRLAELTNSINGWEDESVNKLRPNKNDKDTTSASSTSRSYETAASTSKSYEKPITKSPGKSASILGRVQSIEKKETDNNKNSNNKQLKWDKSIMDSLESQGYKRRDTTTKRLEYNFGEQTDSNNTNVKVSNVTKPPTGQSYASKGAKPKSPKSPKSSEKPECKVEVAKGLVSGRAAIFESSTSRTATATATASSSSTAALKNQKDPAEMTLKERLALFEKNKGTALIPKAALGMAPSAKQIMADKKPSENVKQVITTPQQPIISSHTTTSAAPAAQSKINNFNKASKAETSAAGSGIRQTVAALLSAPATIAESRIANECRKNRQQEMNVVLNRFNQAKEPASPPPAPPMPDNLFKTNSHGRKRLSGKSSNQYHI